MFTPPTTCPNPACKHHGAPAPGWYAKKGYYRTKFDRQPVPRYRCKACGRYFGSHTGTATYRQHKPKENALIAKLLCSGVTMRRTADLVGVTRRTLAKKLQWLAVRARAAHAEYLKRAAYPTSYVQFDEMETYERSKLLPLSIALAVRPKTGYIMGVKVAEMNCHGRPARASVQRYGRRQDTRRAAALSVFREVAMIAKAGLTVATDKKTAYKSLIQTALPGAAHDVHLSRKGPTGSRDPLFHLNHLCAKLRADLARLGRRSWSASKKAACLQDHLDLYVAFNNGYWTE
ncbi:MAG: hypothetical protein WCH57_02660 [Verrucomicrobiota bacterium]